VSSRVPASGRRPDRHYHVHVLVVAERPEDAGRQGPVQLQGELGQLLVLAQIRAFDQEQEIRELQRANEILKRAASFFGAEQGRQHKR